MRRLLLLVLAIWLALCGSAPASAWHRNCTTVSEASSLTTLTVNTPAYQSGNTITLCATIQEAAPATVWPSGFAALTGTGLPAVGTGIWADCAIKTAGSEPPSYTVNWTGGATARLLACSVENTDGSTPAVDVAAGTFVNSANNINPASVTTTQNSDVIDNVVMGGFFLNAASPPASGVFSLNQLSQFNVLLQSFGQPIAGATLVDNVGQAGTDPMTAITIAWKNNTTTAALFHGVGADTSNSGSANALTPPLPVNQNASDTLFAPVYEEPAGIGITTPAASDIQLRAITEATTSNNTNVVSATLTGFHTGDLMTAWTVSSTAHPFTAGCISNSVAWTQYKVDNTNSNFAFWYKTAAAGDVGATLTCTATGNDFLTLVAKSWYSISGGTVSVHAGSIQACASSTTCAPSSITTSVSNTLIEAAAEQFAAVTYTIPKEVTPLYSNTIGFYGQAAAGASITPTFTSSAANGWEGGQIALTSTGAVAGPAWSLVASVADPGLTRQLNLYSLPVPSTGLIGNPQKFYFASNPTKSDGYIGAFSDLDPTTPIEGCTTLGMNPMTFPMAPAYTTLQADELVLMGGMPSVTYGTPILLGASLGVGYGPLSMAGATNGRTANGSPFVTFKCGLKAATTPTRTSAVSRENQVMLMIATTTLPIPVAGASLFELEVP